jgi:hypothetical protein
VGRQYFLPDVQPEIELRLHFMLYILLRHKVYYLLWESLDSVAGSQVLSSILPSIIHIIQTWLSAVQDRQVWKSSYKFYLDTAIINLFDIFKRIHSIPGYEAVINQYSLPDLCWQVLETVKSERESGHVSVVQVSEFGLIMLENMWAGIHT